MFLINSNLKSFDMMLRDRRLIAVLQGLVKSSIYGRFIPHYKSVPMYGLDFVLNSFDYSRPHYVICYVTQERQLLSNLSAWLMVNSSRKRHYAFFCTLFIHLWSRAIIINQIMCILFCKFGSMCCAKWFFHQALSCTFINLNLY